MIVEYIRYSLPASLPEPFLADYSRAARVLDESDHCRGYQLCRCVDEPNVFVLRIEWDSVAGHMEGFRKSPGFRDFLEAIRRYIPHILEMRHYEVTEVRSRR
jgi:quinol monooxygenase YgiN